ncbi:2-oxo acid dehydrogenase subunit E2 [Aliamphritea ceti]|uniref:2-oxo acid dehydrogenase subunit E2 n=1 Tax=Aliamphritea ceti TaxID=1524258 RepID=UPI0021C27667|nr:2-oxo acid dehydrogenase subunit E2 [Aliamphritea ceti]
MTTEIVLMPDVDGAGDVVEYCIELGDEITAGDPMLVIESDKASVEIPASISGLVTEWLVQIGDRVSKDHPLAQVKITAQETPVHEPINTDTQVETVLTEKTAKSSPAVLSANQMPAPQSPVSVTPAISNSVIKQQGSYYAGPAVRKLAREFSVNLTQVNGTGPGGRILKENIHAYVKQQLIKASQPVISSAAIPPLPKEDFSRFGDTDTQSLSSIAKATSAHMTRCWLNIPHVTLFDETNISDLEAFRKTIQPEAYGLEKTPSILPFIVLTIARALVKFPRFNSSLHPDGTQLIYKQYTNIGVAVDTPAGLVVPVIRNANQQSVSQLASTINALANKARNKQLKIADMQGGCFTISSLGSNGGSGFTPIINGPEVAILGVGKATIKPVWDGEAFQPGLLLPLSLSFDHRVINGAEAGRFMAYISNKLRDIKQLLL